MTGIVLLAVLAALALLSRVRLGVRGAYTPQTAGVWLRIGPAERKVFPLKTKQKPKPKKRQDGGERPAEKPEKKPLLSPGGMFQLVRRLLPTAWEGAGAFWRRLQVDRLRVEVLAGAPDPAEAALRYGQISALAGAVWGPMTQTLRIRDGRVHVEPDFTRTEPALYGEVALSLTAGQLLWLGLRYGPWCLKIFLDVRRQEKAAEARQRKAA